VIDLQYFYRQEIRENPLFCFFGIFQASRRETFFILAVIRKGNLCPSACFISPRGCKALAKREAGRADRQQTDSRAVRSERLYLKAYLNFFTKEREGV